MKIAVLATALGCSGGAQIETEPVPETTGDLSTAATLGIPPGHLPAPGQCRLWEPGHPPGRQRHLPSGGCDRIERTVSPGQWIVYRPGTDRKIVEVRMYGHLGGPNPRINLIRIFDIATGELLREETP